MKSEDLPHIAKLIAICLLISMAFGILYTCDTDEFKQPEERKAPQVVYVEKLVPYEVKTMVMPSKILIQSMVDSTLRARKEKETIILGQERISKKNTHYLNIQTIDTLGTIKQMEYQVMEGDLYKMDSEGNIEIDQQNRKKLLRKERRKRFFRKAAVVTAFGAGVVIGVSVAK